MAKHGSSLLVRAVVFWQGLDPKHVVILSFLVYSGAIVRLLYSPSQGLLSPDAMLAVAITGILVAFVELGRVVSNAGYEDDGSRFTTYVLLLVDLVLITTLYAGCGRLDSDFFIFYTLPILGAQARLNAGGIRTITGLACFGLLVAIVILQSGPPTAEVLFTKLLPREIFLIVAAFLALQVRESRDDQAKVQSARAEMVPATASAFVLDREIDALLDEVIQAGFDYGAVGLVDDFMRTVGLVRARNLSPVQVRECEYSLDPPPGEVPDIMVDLVRNPKTVLFPAGVYDTRFNRRIYDHFGQQKLARIFIALVDDNKVIGTLECGCFASAAMTPDATTHYVFDRQVAAEQIARRYQQRLGERRTHALLSKIAYHACDIIGADSASIHVFESRPDPKTNRRRVIYQAGAGNANPEFVREFGPEELVTEWNILNSEDVITVTEVQLQSLRPELYDRGVRSMATFALQQLGDERLKGILSVQFWRRGAFRNRQVRAEREFVKELEGIVSNYLSLQRSVNVVGRSWEVLLLQRSVQSLTSAGDTRELLEGVARNVLFYIPSSQRVRLFECRPGTRELSGSPVLMSSDEYEALPEDAPPKVTDTDQFVPGTATLVLKTQPTVDLSGEIVGVLEIRYAGQHQPAAPEQRALGTFAATAAVALIDARQRQRIRNLEQTVNELRKGESLADVLATILPALRASVPFETASLQSIRSGKRQHLATYGFDTAGADAFFLSDLSEDELVREVVAQGTPKLIPDTTKQKPWGTPEIVAWIGMPLVTKQGTIGFVTMDSTQRQAFDTVDIDVLMRLAEQVATRLDEALRRDRTERQIYDLSLVNRIYEDIHTHRSVKQLAELVAGHLARGLRGDQCSIYFATRTASPDGVALKRSATFGKHSRQVSARKPLLPVEHNDSPAALGFNEGVTLWDGSMEMELLNGQQRDRRLAKRVGIAVPITTGDQRLGVITIERDSTSRFDENDAELLQAIASATATAIERDRGVELLQALGDRILAAQNVDGVMGLIVDGVVSLLNVDASTLVVGDTRGPSLRVVRVFGAPNRSLPDPRPHGLTECIMRLERVARIEDLADRSAVRKALFSDLGKRKGRRLARGLVLHGLSRDFRSLIAVPLKTQVNEGGQVRAQVDGLLYLFSRSKRHFTELEASLLQSLANHGSLVIQKTIVLDDMRKRGAALSRIASTGQLAGQVFHRLIDPSVKMTLAVSEFALDLQGVERGLAQAAGAIEQERLPAAKAALQQAQDRNTKAQKLADHLKGDSELIAKVLSRIDRSMQQVSSDDRHHSPGPISTRRLLMNACDHVTEKFGLRGEQDPIVRHFEEGSFHVVVSELLITEAFVNLIENAVEAVAKNLPGEPREVHVRMRLHADGRRQEVIIADTGPGIPVKEHELIYNADYSSKQHKVGYGLWLVKAALDASGIEINLDRKDGPGATFRVLIPLSPEELKQSVQWN